MSESSSELELYSWAAVSFARAAASIFQIFEIAVCKWAIFRIKNSDKTDLTFSYTKRFMPSFLEIFVKILLFNSSCEKDPKFFKEG